MWRACSRERGDADRDITSHSKSALLNGRQSGPIADHRAYRELNYYFPSPSRPPFHRGSARE
ncbi:hypothetical protein CEXT_571631, partial [Caerostris extrusa]